MDENNVSENTKKAVKCELLISLIKRDILINFKT